MPYVSPSLTAGTASAAHAIHPFDIDTAISDSLRVGLHRADDSFD
jgi:hypothetical protein